MLCLILYACRRTYIWPLRRIAVLFGNDISVQMSRANNSRARAYDLRWTIDNS